MCFTENNSKTILAQNIVSHLHSTSFECYERQMDFETTLYYIVIYYNTQRCFDVTILMLFKCYGYQMNVETVCSMFYVYCITLLLLLKHYNQPHLNVL